MVFKALLFVCFTISLLSAADKKDKILPKQIKAKDTVFHSDLITSKTKDHQVNIDIDIKNKKQLILIVWSGGDYACDWANWVDPKLTGPKGEKKLTELKWKSATAGWGKVQLNKNAGGKGMKVKGRSVNGIGAHASSIIVYDIPAGYERFKAIGALDDGGTSQQNGTATSVQFIVLADKDKNYLKKLNALSGASDVTPATPEDAYVPTDLFTVPEGFEITLWGRSPLFYNPTNMDIDSKGRVWVCEGRNYRRNRGAADGDRVMVVEDSNKDGKADKSWVFVQDKDLIAPLGVAVIGNKVVVSQPPNLYVYTDIDGDAKFDPEKDKKETLLTGWGGRNHDHSLHSVTVGPSGQWYYNTGNAGNPDVTGPDGWHLIAGSGYGGGKKKAGKKSSDGFAYIGGLALRMNPDGTGMRVIGHNFRNSYEQAVTSFGDVFQNDNDDPPASRTTWLMEYGNLGYYSNDGQRSWRAGKHPGQTTQQAEWRQDNPGSLPAGDVYGGGSPTGIAYYENGALADKWNGLVLSCEPSRNVVFGYLPKPSGAGFTMERFDFLTSNTSGKFEGADFTGGRSKRMETLFRPSDVCIGPDGAIYVADWYDSRVGGHAAFDKTYSGTIYRIAPKGAKLSVPVSDTNSTEGLINILKSPSPNVRATAFYLLKEKGASAVNAVAALLNDKNEYLQARAIWLLAQMGPTGIAKVEKILSHKNAQMRIAAFRSLRFIESNMLKHAAVLSTDSSPAVRREVALAMRYIQFEQAKEILSNIAKGYDGKDRWYLESLGTGASNKETRLYNILLKSLGHADGTKWDARFAGIAFRLHPLNAVKGLQEHALSGAPEEQAKMAINGLAFINSPQAVKAMKEISEKIENKNLKSLAAWWIKYRGQNLWRSFMKSEKLVYTDNIIPTVLGKGKEMTIKEVLSLKGDAKKGQLAIARCYMCHQIGDSGLEFGPTLTGWSKGQSREIIAKAIVDPNIDIAHDFKGTEIKTKDGKTIQGFVIADGDLTIVKTFGAAQVAIDSKDIASRTEMKNSVMPTAANQGLTAQDVANIIEYLKSGK